METLSTNSQASNEAFPHFTMFFITLIYFHDIWVSWVRIMGQTAELRADYITVPHEQEISVALGLCSAL